MTPEEPLDFAAAAASGPVPVFRDRRDAGAQLGHAIAALGAGPGRLVLAIPRGGVPVGYEVALALAAPLDVVIVRKLGHPEQPELAMGAIASGGVRVLNPAALVGVSRQELEEVAAREAAELDRRERSYREGRPAVDPRGRPIVLVDDGLATGSSMRAAIAALRQRGAGSILAAAPVAPTSTASEMRRLADRFVCLIEAEIFLAVGEWYEDFSATSDDEVRSLLASAARRPPAPAPRGAVGDHARAG